MCVLFHPNQDRILEPERSKTEISKKNHYNFIVVSKPINQTKLHKQTERTTVFK